MKPWLFRCVIHRHYAELEDWYDWRKLKKSDIIRTSKSWEF